MAQRRLSGIAQHINTNIRSIHATSPRRMTLAKPADSLKEAKVLSRGENKEPKWVQLEGRASAYVHTLASRYLSEPAFALRSHQVADTGRQGEGLVSGAPIGAAHSRLPDGCLN